MAKPNEEADAGVLADIERFEESFFPKAKPHPKDNSYWWFAYDRAKDEPIGYAGLDVLDGEGIGILCRSGVMPEYRGLGIQKRFILARERMARRLGLEEMQAIVKYQRPLRFENAVSANNLISRGYRLFVPNSQEGRRCDFLYFRKRL